MPDHPLSSETTPRPSQARRMIRSTNSASAHGAPPTTAAALMITAIAGFSDQSYTPGVDDERHGAGMPVPDRQQVPLRSDALGRPLVPSRVPETRPTPLQDSFIYLSIGVLICGVVAISALEIGTPLGAPIVKIPVLIGGVLLAAVTGDAIVRIWRSALAWLPVDRGRGQFRFVWVATLVLALLILGAIMALVLTA